MKYIIGDVHGTFSTLIELMLKVPTDEIKDIVFVGDLIDRGPNSRMVIDYIREKGFDCVRGNHEDLLIEVWDDYKEYGTPIDGRNMWTMNGGHACLNNYRDEFHNIDYEALEIDVEFLRELPDVLVYGDEVDEQGRVLVITHATSISFIDNYFALMAEYQGVDIETLSIEVEHQLSNMGQLIIWNRSIPKVGSDEFFNVSGHNIIDAYIGADVGILKVPKEQITKDFILVDKEKGYACIDTAAFSKNAPGGDRNCEDKANNYRGKLTCLEFPSMKVIQQCNSEDFDWNER